MSKKIDLSKILTKGSAKQRASLLIYHYNILEAIGNGNNDLKRILTDQEAQAIYNSFKTPKEAEAYNNYRALNIEIIRHGKNLSYKAIVFERDFYKCFSDFLLFNKINKPDNKGRNVNALIETILIHSYSDLLNFYTALRIYAKENGYTDKYMLGLMEDIMDNEQTFKNEYLTNVNGVDIIQDLKEIEPDEEEVKNILLKEFNYNYEKED